MRTDDSFQASLQIGREAEHAVRRYLVSEYNCVVLPEFRAPDRRYAGPRITTPDGEYVSPDIAAVSTGGIVWLVEVKRKRQLWYSNECGCHVVEVSESLWNDYAAVSGMTRMDQFDFYMAVCVDRETEYKKRIARRGLYFANFWSISNAIARGRTNTKTLSGRRLIEIPIDVFTYNGTMDWCYSG